MFNGKLMGLQNSSTCQIVSTFAKKKSYRFSYLYSLGEIYSDRMSFFSDLLKDRSDLPHKNCYSIKQRPIVVTPTGNSKVSLQPALTHLLHASRKFHPRSGSTIKG
jgi:hypothetical protein